jgi:hypothetical protein
MSIPLDRLYHYIESVAQEVYGDTIIYHFWPHGSKNVQDLNSIRTYPETEVLTRPQIFCNDQEPLNFDLYSDYSHYTLPLDVHNLVIEKMFKHNLRKNIFNIFDKSIILHSEKKSAEIDKYAEAGFIPVYYWIHALIAIDWFRYAKYSKKTPRLNKIDFLIYNRSWTGSREYRLKVADLLIDNNLVHNCKTSLRFVDDQCHYSDHVYKNTVWRPTNCLENYFTENTTTSCYSADFDFQDYQNTNCEVILETLFDTSQLHLTEKTLRPIALGHPFLLCGPAGSLQYLRDYGFKTFESVINEDYDLISDPTQRLLAVLKIMKTMAAWSDSEKQQKFLQMQEIADFNKQYFFNNDFFNLITGELKENLKQGINQLVYSNTFDRCITLNQSLSNDEKYVIWQNTYVPRECIEANNYAYNTAIQLKNLNKY